jgi:hypothetical protein
MISYGKLTWELMPLSKLVDFMDLTLSVTDTGIHMCLLEKN